MNILFEKGECRAILIRSKCPKQGTLSANVCNSSLSLKEDESDIDMQNQFVLETAHLTAGLPYTELIIYQQCNKIAKPIPPAMLFVPY